MKSSSLISTAVAAALGWGAALAQPPTTTPDVTLIVSGSSAFKAAFENELSRAGSSVCQTSGTTTYNKYTAAVTSGPVPDFNAYNCLSVTDFFGAGTGTKNILIYYRAEGGSVFGLTPLIRAPNNKVLRLQLNANCTTPAAGATGTCPVGVYSPVPDTITGTNAVDANTDLGLADEEPAQFRTPNYPDAGTAAKLQPALTDAERLTLGNNAQTLVGQSFGFYTHIETAAPGAGDTQLNGLTSLSRESLAAIMSGTWGDWNQVPKNDGTNTTVVSGGNSVPIVVCRREAGSGTQVATSIFLHNTNCGGADNFVTSANPGNLASVIENTATATMRTCIEGNKGAIGYISSEANTANRKQVQVDGKGTTSSANNLGVATASGDYGFMYELVAVKKPGLAGNTNILADKLISVAHDQTTGPTTPNVTFLPTGTNAGNAVFPLNTPAGKQPVTCFTRSGNSCATLADQC
ncbi:MAG TPA: substrate-binding domain-containing protein [Steroidobacteraceae bacterium]|nr:substrate-binding domain-containing protein [Steroidobacteraceae bacterium]